MWRSKLTLWPNRFLHWVKGAFKPKKTMTSRISEETPPAPSPSVEIFDPSPETSTTGMKFLLLSAASSSLSLQSRSCVITSPVDTFFTAPGAIESPIQKDPIAVTAANIQPRKDRKRPYVPPIITNFPRRK